jgi:hypothetical protein
MPATDLRRQFLAEGRQLLSRRRSNVCREVAVSGGSPPHRNMANQVRKLAGGQPGGNHVSVRRQLGATLVLLLAVSARHEGAEVDLGTCETSVGAWEFAGLIEPANARQARLNSCVAMQDYVRIA